MFFPVSGVMLLCIIKVNKRKLRTNTNHVALRNSFCINLPIIGIIKAVVIEPGINNKPASVAVHPKMDCVYIGYQCAI
jgi:hypothetical protein